MSVVSCIICGCDMGIYCMPNMFSIYCNNPECHYRFESLVLQDKDGIHWQNLMRDGEQVLLSCERGYLHNITPSIVNEMTIIGKFEDNKELFQCD